MKIIMIQQEKDSLIKPALIDPTNFDLIVFTQKAIAAKICGLCTFHTAIRWDINMN